MPTLPDLAAGEARFATRHFSRTANREMRPVLFERNDDVRRRLHSAHRRQQWHISRAQTGRNRKVDLVQTGGGQTRENRDDTHAIDEDADWTGG